MRLGVDVGKVRVGVADLDPDGILATPLVTLARRPGRRRRTQCRPTWPSWPALIAEHEAVEVVVGLPVNLAGEHGPAAEHVKAYAARLADVIAPVPVPLT